MRKFSLLLLLSVLFHSSLLGQNQKELVSIAPKPKWAKEITYPTSNKKSGSEYEGGSDYLLVSRQYHLEEEIYYGRFATKVLNESGLQELSSVSLTFDPIYQKVQFHSVKVLRKGQEINKLNYADIQILQRETNAETHIYDGSLTALIHLKDIRIGDIIEYDFSIEGRNPAYKNLFFTDFYWQFTVPVEKMYFRIIKSQARVIHIKNLGNTPELQKFKFKGKDEYVWEKSQIPALIYDTNTPSWYDPAPATIVSEFDSWQAVTNLLLEHYGLNQGLPAKQEEMLHKQLFNSFDTQESKIKKLLNFVQDEIRYLGLEEGISAYKPHPPAEVLHQKYGDCKDKSLLLCHLLKGIGVKAYPALVNTSLRSAVEKLLPSPGIFNHCVVMVEVNDTTIWYDPTIPSQGGLYNSTTFPLYGKALILRKGENRLVDIPAYPIGKREMVEYFRIRLKGESSQLSIISRFWGFEADNQRSMFKSRSIDEIEKNYLNYSANWYPDIKTRKPLKVRDEAKKFETEENYTINSIWQQSEEEEGNLYVNFYPQYISEFMQKPDVKVRSMPLHLNYPLKVEEKIIVELPGSWPVNPDEQLIENDFFRFSAKVIPEGSVFTLVYSFELLKDHVPAGEMPVYLTDLEKALNQLGYQIFHFDAESNTPELSIPMVALSILTLAFFIFTAVKLDTSINPLPVREAEYYSISGWLFLPMFGLLLTPFFIAMQLISWDFYNGEMLHKLFISESSIYNPLLGVVIGMELIFNIMMIVFAIFLLTLMFKRRTSFPPLFKAYLIVNALFLILELLILQPSDLLNSIEMKDLYRQTAQAIIGAAVWIPYFSYSERVKCTFTQRYINMKEPAGIMEYEKDSNEILE